MQWMIWVGCIALVAVAVYLLLARRKKDSAATPPSEESREPDPVDDLVGLNLELRLAQIGGELTERTEAAVDDLIKLLPMVNDSDVFSGDLRWTVNRIATEYLPNKCVRPFLKLSATERAEPAIRDAYIEGIETLQREITDVFDVLSRKDRTEFDAKAKFLKHRFTNTGAA